MRRSYVISILWCLFLCSLIGMAFLVNKYINDKRGRLRTEIRNNIEKLFDGQSGGDGVVGNDDGFFDEVYSGSPVRHYKNIPIPKKPSTSPLFKQLKQVDEQMDEEWQQNYGDLYALYALNWGDEYPDEKDDGWNIVRVHCGGTDDDFIRTNIIFPYKVGLKKTEWGNYYTVEQAVNEAFDFYTTNPKSSFVERYKKGSNRRLWSDIRNCENEYFWIAENKHPNSWTAGTPIYKPKGKSYEDAQRLCPYENGSMYNGFYRVFIAATQETHYMIEEKEWVVNNDKKNLFIAWGVGLSILFLSFIIPLSIQEFKSNKRKNESPRQRLIRLCNPQNFIKNYNKEKLDKANDIYQKLMCVKDDENEAIRDLQNIAIAELGISLINEEEIEDLKRKVNPQNFLSPYNAEKVTLANELYSTLSKKDLTYDEFIDVKEKSQAL